MRKLAFVLLGLALFSLAACGGDEAAPASGERGAAGKEIFNQAIIGTQAGCMTCHSLEPSVTMLGPSLGKIGVEAGSRVPGVSAEDYLRRSILEPDADVAEGFTPGIMPKALADELSEQQLNDLVAFMLTLE